MLGFGVLGPLEAEKDGVHVRLGAAKQQALLALLLLESGRTVSTQRLSDGLWGEGAPASAAKNLQLYVSQLRKLLGAEAIATRGDGYALPLRGRSLDLARFEELADAGRSQASTSRGSRLPARGSRSSGWPQRSSRSARAWPRAGTATCCPS
jgi:DNA-binding SARP family transcriptional activator